MTRLSYRNIPLIFALLLVVGLLVVAAVEEAQPFEIHRSAGQTIAGKQRVSTSPYTYDISEGNIGDHDPWRAIGHNGTVGAAFEIVWDYSAGSPFISGSTTVRLSSSSTADTTGVSVTVLNASNALAIHSVTLNGQTPVTLAGVSPYRVLRMENNSSADYVGDVYAAGIDSTYAGGVPQQASLVLGKVAIGFGITQNAWFTVPAGKAAYVAAFGASTSTTKLTEIALQYRPYGQAWKTDRLVHLNQYAVFDPIIFPLSCPSLCDIRVVAAAGGGGGDVSAGFALWYED